MFQNQHIIREQITPKGDGNYFRLSTLYSFLKIIREQITPKGDGNISNSFKFFNSNILENR